MKYQSRIDARRLVFLDETWTKTNMAPLRGWAACGKRLVAKVPHRRWKTTTFVAALRLDRIDAPCVLGQPINGPKVSRLRACLRLPQHPDNLLFREWLALHLVSDRL